MTGILLLGVSMGVGAAPSTPGVYPDRIVVGGVMDLEGQSRGLGLGMRDGIQAAFKGVQIQGRPLEFRSQNDSYSPDLTISQTQRLLDEGIFVMLGNVGTPTAQVSLPLLADAKVPAIGFFTGAGLLRPGQGDVINFRASYTQETAAVISNGLQAGLQPAEICAYVQNDAYGMSGVEGIRRALQGQPRAGDIVRRLEAMLTIQGDSPARNGLGPVGVYERNTLSSREGYESLKKWERDSGSHCKLVVTVGTYNAIGRFAAYARSRGDQWLVSAVSFTGADDLQATLAQFGVKDRVIVSQVVPPLDADLPLLRAAREALGDRLSHVSLEGYIVGRMLVKALQQIKGEITRESLLAVWRNQALELDGLALDFRDDNQGSDLVSLTWLGPQGFQPMPDEHWRGLF